MSFESDKYIHYSTYCTLYRPGRNSWEKDIHVHTVEELLLITGTGSCTIISNGHTVRIDAPALIWNRLGSFHAVTHYDEGLSIHVMTFLPEIFSEAHRSFLRLDYLEDHAFFALPLTNTHAERMLQLYSTLKGSPSFQRQLIFPCIFHQIELYLSAGSTPIRFGSTNNYIFDVITILQRMESERITIPELAARFNVGTTKLKKDFKALTSQTIHSFQLRSRLHTVYRLLANTQMTQAQIAAHCGFTDESHMIRAFRKYSGMTPAEYRNKYNDRWRNK